jgi:hypothetical protein
MRFGLVALALMAGGHVGEAFAQDALQPDERVRLHANCSARRDVACERFVGTVAAVKSDTVRLALQDGRVTAIPWASVAHLEVQRGRKGAWATGALIGGLVGTAAGLLAASATREESPAGSNPCGFGDAMVVAYAGLGGMLLGAVMGGVPQEWIGGYGSSRGSACRARSP